MKINLKKTIAICLALCIIFWIIAIAKCELLSCMYGKEFYEIYKENTMIGEIDYLKVLKYSKSSAYVYYLSEGHRAGNVVCYYKNNNEWILESWDTIWSTSGTADGTIFPYLWHYIYAHPRLSDN